MKSKVFVSVLDSEFVMAKSIINLKLLEGFGLKF